MRKENYLLGMINKKILKLNVWRIKLVTISVEWCLYYTIFSFLFDENTNSLRPEIINAKPGSMEFLSLSKGLKRRFRALGVFTLLVSPFIILFYSIYILLRYGEEIKNNPSVLSTRQYSTLARWKLREFNELPHHFSQRLAQSYDSAQKYVAQFQSNYLAVIARLFSFIAGAFIVVLVGLAIYNDEILFKLNVLGEQGVIWIIGVLGTIIAISRSFIPDENSIFCPEKYMDKVVKQTHYLPKSWRGRCHFYNVYQEFTDLFEYRLVGFFRELFGVLLLPFLLFFSLPTCADDVIMFFSEYSQNVEGLGYVCSFATFTLDKHGNFKYGAPVSGSKQQRSKQGKMEKSLINFMKQYLNWEPSDENAGSLILNLSQYSDSAASGDFSSSASTFSIRSNSLGSSMGKSVHLENLRRRKETPDDSILRDRSETKLRVTPTETDLNTLQQFYYLSMTRD